MAAQLAQTIAIFDKSGKAVSTVSFPLSLSRQTSDSKYVLIRVLQSKQLKNVFNEAKSAYRERKAEIVAQREAKEQHELRKAIKAMSVADESRTDGSSSTRMASHSRRGPEQLRVRPPTSERGYSGSSARSGTSSVSPRSPSRRHSPHHLPPHLQDDVYGASRSAPGSPTGASGGSSRELVRSHTDMDLALPARRPHTPVRSHSASAIDMDLAYGDFHHESLRGAPLIPYAPAEKQEQELSSLVLKAKLLLDEANCAQHSVKAIVAHLQKNPDAMAAVALTLAEISNVVSKMAPGALGALKIGAPGVFALLAAPEFLIAVGVGLGITVVMFGGYKIIKKIKANGGGKEKDGVDEMLEIGQDVNRIEHWRRGIADVGGGPAGADDETASVGTSVEGEYITPIAAASMGHLPMDPRMRDLKKGGKKKSSSSRKEGKRELEE